MSGGFEYNLTTESEYEEMRQRNMELTQENHGLKRTLEEMIKLNNQLSDTIEQFNNAAITDPHLIQHLQRHPPTTRQAPIDHSQCHQMIGNLEQQVQYFKGLTYQKIGMEDNPEIVNALEGLVESFKQTQKYYEEQITAISDQLDVYKTEWDNKILKAEETYFGKTKILDDIIKELRKKDEIVSIIQKRIKEEFPREKKKILKKHSQIDTSSQRKIQKYHQLQQVDLIQEKLDTLSSINKEVDYLKLQEKKLKQQLKEKDQTIAIYSDLLANLRKKLSQKF